MSNRRYRLSEREIQKIVDGPKTLLERWAHAARCRRPTSQQKANNLWHQLKPLLPEEITSKLSTAWSHAIMAEQCPKELDALVKKLIEEGI